MKKVAYSSRLEYSHHLMMQHDNTHAKTHHLCVDLRGYISSEWDPGPRGFLLILSFLFVNLQSEVLIEVQSREKRKGKIVENLTFMLAQHLTVVKDVIFF